MREGREDDVSQKEQGSHKECADVGAQIAEDANTSGVDHNVGWIVVNLDVYAQSVETCSVDGDRSELGIDAVL